MAALPSWQFLVFFLEQAALLCTQQPLACITRCRPCGWAFWPEGGLLQSQASAQDVYRRAESCHQRGVPVDSASNFLIICICMCCHAVQPQM